MSHIAYQIINYSKHCRKTMRNGAVGLIPELKWWYNTTTKKPSENPEFRMAINFSSM